MKPLKILKFFLRFTSLEIMAHLAYPGQLLMFALSQLIFSISGPVIAVIVYGVGKGIPGWSFYEFLIFNGTFTLVYGIWGTFFLAQIWRLSRDIENGSFDKFLIRPVKFPLYLLISGFDLDWIGQSAFGLFLILYPIILGKVNVTVMNVLIYLFLILLSAFVGYAMVMFIAGLEIIFVKRETIWNIIDSVVEFVRYPLNIYGPVIQFVFTFVLPFGLASFYPTQALFGRLNLFTLIPFTILSVGFLLVAIKFLNFAVKKYTSAGG